MNCVTYESQLNEVIFLALREHILKLETKIRFSEYFIIVFDLWYYKEWIKEWLASLSMRVN